MTRSLPWFWIGLAGLLLLLPGPAGRLLLDLIGGLTLTLLLLPLLAGGAALIGWQLLRRRLLTCAACGFTSLASEACPSCGERFASAGAVGSPEGPFGAGSGRLDPDIDPRTATINVQAVDVGDSDEGSAGS